MKQFGALVLFVIALALLAFGGAGCATRQVYRLGAGESVVIYERDQIINASSTGELKRLWLK